VDNLPFGRIVLTVTVISSHGRRATTTRLYRTCAIGPKGPVAPGKVPAPVQPTVPSPPPPAADLPPQPGRYTARASGYEFSFYVAPDGGQVQDVAVAGLGVRCAPGNGTFGTPFYMPEIAIAADGSFAGQRTEEGDVSGTPAEFTYVFSGRFAGTTVVGSLREDVVYGDGTRFSCTSSIVPWSGTRDTQPVQTASPAAPGSYAARTTTPATYAFSFLASADGSHLQEIALTGLGVRCAPGNGTFGAPLYFPEIAVDGDGSFRATRTETGVVQGFAAAFTYTFEGHLHGYDSSGRARIAGALRMDVTYDNGAPRSCTSNIVPWSAVH
jgi:hypothetical protein